MQIINTEKCYDNQLDETEGNKYIQLELIKNCLGMANKEFDQHITISIRAKDENGWYNNICTYPLDKIQSGDEIILDCGKVYKITIS